MTTPTVGSNWVTVLGVAAVLWNTRVIGLSCNLKSKPQGQLPHASIYGRASDNAERGRCEVCVGVRKLWMIQGVVELGTKLETAVLHGPPKDHLL